MSKMTNKTVRCRYCGVTCLGTCTRDHIAPKSEGYDFKWNKAYACRRLQEDRLLAAELRVMPVDGVCAGVTTLPANTASDSRLFNRRSILLRQDLVHQIPYEDVPLG